MKRQYSVAEKQEIIKLQHINVTKTDTGSRIDYEYTTPERIVPYIKPEYIKRKERLFVEIPGDASIIPEAILAIPFVGVMLTITSILGVSIEVPVIEKNFYDSLKDVLKAYDKMFPKKEIVISVMANEVIEVEYGGHESRTGLLFTGGVDATDALAVVKDKHPLLINIWGGDIRLTDEDSHLELVNYLNDLTNVIKENYCFIRTNAREMFEENKLGTRCEMLGHKNNHGWWASIAHILSMTSVIAPYLYLQGTGVIYIGSSWDGATIDSNNEEFVHAIKYGETRFEIVDEYVDRNEKIETIIAFKERYNIPLELKVCWKRTAGKNCCRCEKCYRTIMGIICNHADPNNYGFSVDEKTIQCIQHYLNNYIVNIGFWQSIIDRFKEDAGYWEGIKDMSWVLSVKLNTPSKYFKTAIRKISRSKWG